MEKWLVLTQTLLQLAHSGPLWAGPLGRVWMVPGATSGHYCGWKGTSEGGPGTREGAFALVTSFKGQPCKKYKGLIRKWEG